MGKYPLFAYLIKLWIMWDIHFEKEQNICLYNIRLFVCHRQTKTIEFVTKVTHVSKEHASDNIV